MAPKKKTAEPTRIGRPPVKIDADNLRKVAALRCTVEEAATFFKTVKRTLLRRLKEDTELAEAWANGKNEGRIALRRLQWRHAQTPGSAGVQMTIHLSKHELGETDKSLLELTGKDGGAIETRDVSARAVITGRIASIAARRRTPEDTGGPVGSAA